MKPCFIYAFIFLSLELGSTLILFRLAHGQTVLEQGINFVTDPVGFRKGSDNATKAANILSTSFERTMNQAAALERSGYRDAQILLDQAHSILQEGLNGSNLLLKNAADKMSALEDKVDRDAIDFLHRARCVGSQASFTVNSTFTELINHLRFTPVNVSNPEETYLEIRQKAFTALEKHGSEDFDASEIFWTYQHLILAAEAARCIYIDKDGAIPFTREINMLELLSHPWISVVHVKTL